jgi:hypothetical protein
MHTFVQSIIKALCSAQAADDLDQIIVAPKAIFMCMGAFKHDNGNAFAKCFTANDRKLQKSICKYFITYEESSLRKRRLRDRPEASFDVVEMLHCISAENLSLPPKMRLTFTNCSNQNNHIGPVVTEDPTGPTE